MFGFRIVLHDSLIVCQHSHMFGFQIVLHDSLIVCQHSPRISVAVSRLRNMIAESFVPTVWCPMENRILIRFQKWKFAIVFFLSLHRWVLVFECLVASDPTLPVIYNTPHRNYHKSHLMNTMLNTKGKAFSVYVFPSNAIKILKSTILP